MSAISKLNHLSYRSTTFTMPSAYSVSAKLLNQPLTSFFSPRISTKNSSTKKKWWYLLEAKSSWLKSGTKSSVIQELVEISIVLSEKSHNSFYSFLFVSLRVWLIVWVFLCHKSKNTLRTHSFIALITTNNFMMKYALKFVKS